MLQGHVRVCVCFSFFSSVNLTENSLFYENGLKMRKSCQRRAGMTLSQPGNVAKSAQIQRARFLSLASNHLR